MAEIKGPGNSAFGMVKGPAPKVPPSTQNVVKTADQLLREAAFREGFNKGLHEGGHKNIWKGMGFAYFSMLIAWLAMLGYDMSLSENKRAERFMAVREAEHTRDILNESSAMKADVVEPEAPK